MLTTGQKVGFITKIKNAGKTTEEEIAAWIIIEDPKVGLICAQHVIMASLPVSGTSGVGG